MLMGQDLVNKGNSVDLLRIQEAIIQSNPKECWEFALCGCLCEWALQAKMIKWQIMFLKEKAGQVFPVTDFLLSNRREEPSLPFMDEVPLLSYSYS